MLRLFTFGPPVVVGGPGTRLDELARQTKRLGLLVYLTCGEKRVHRRDELLPVFWPESDEESARNCLRQSLHVLRGLLGPGVLLGNGDQEIGVDPARLESDVAVFLRALGAGSAEGALDLYLADFLDGFHVPEAPQFERWTDQRRQKLRTLATNAARQLAHTAEGLGDVPAALRWWKRTAELAPFDEGVVRRIVTLLLVSGNRAEAIRTLTAFQALLMRELEVEPSRETTELLETARAGRVPDPPDDLRLRRRRPQAPPAVHRRQVIDRFWMGTPGPGE